MTFTRDPYLADAAAHERDVREKNFPALIDAGKITKDDAAAELLAWRAIAELMDRGWTERALSWSHLHLYTSRHLQALERDVEAAALNPDAAGRLAKLHDRRALASAIHHIIDLRKFMFDDGTRMLREQAKGRLAA